MVSSHFPFLEHSPAMSLGLLFLTIAEGVLIKIAYSISVKAFIESLPSVRMTTLEIDVAKKI